MLSLCELRPVHELPLLLIATQPCALAWNAKRINNPMTAPSHVSFLDLNVKFDMSLVLKDK